MESALGSFERRLPIPEGVKEDEIVATYTEGLLEIVLPGAAPAVELPEVPKPEVKTIPIKAA